jgi:orotidine-5'-phosphate decarboxylase
MIMAAREALYETAKNYCIERPKLIAVTVLTSIDEMELRRMGIDIEIQILTANLALLAKEAGLDGVVAAGPDIEMIRDGCGKGFIIVTPGVRIAARGDDQKRTISPFEAIAKGATYIVLGRTLMDSDDPKAFLKRISMEIG